METTFYFVRHGETEYNRQRIVQGRRINAELNETGRQQAEALARRFAGVPLDAIYTSTLRRAEETAAAVAAAHPGVPVHCLEDLEEMSWGVYEGEPASQRVRELYEGLQADWARGEFGQPVEGGESILDVQRRALRAMMRMLERESGRTLLVVAHGRLLRVLLASLLDEYGLERMGEIKHANTSVNHVLHNGDGFTARLLNCTLHLDEIAVG